jgi:hypothetical protein
VGSPRGFAYIQAMAKQLPKDSSDGPLDPGTPGKPKYRIAERDGKRVRLRVVDADNANFAANFQASFAANVRRARDENRALDED